MKICYYLSILFLLSCGPTKKEKKITSNPSSIPKELIKKAGPNYKSYYSASEVTLEEIAYSSGFGQQLAVEIMVNSCNEIKADYLNYMMESYQTTDLDENELEPMFDAEHLGKFIVWQYVNQETKCLNDFFQAMDKVFAYGNSDAIFLAKYGVLEMIILESRKLDVNYNTAFLPFFSEDGTKRFFDFLYTEIESGSS